VRRKAGAERLTPNANFRLMRRAWLRPIRYQQLRSKHMQEAIALFKLNVEMYPDAFNTYDSLAEAHMVQGDRETS
jgi:hypothetical protein